ncbi:MAG: YibE/F family protein [bacterium]|nr:YibE/F family protein [bacterium]
MSCRIARSSVGILCSVVGLLFFLSVSAAYAAPALDTSSDPPDEFFRGRVLSVVKEGQEDIAGYTHRYQLLRIKALTGSDKGKEFEIENGGILPTDELQRAKLGETVVVLKTQQQGETTYSMVDTYRLPSLVIVTLIFLVLVLIWGRLRGVTAVAGLAFTIFVIIAFMIPRILAGNDPFWVSLGSAGVIAVVSLYLAHGLNKRTSIAVVSTLLTLGITAGIAVAFVSMTHLFGLGSETALYLQFGGLEKINLRGLLLGAIIIGSLGVLDDITTGQAAALQEIKRVNPRLSFRELYSHGTAIGREHIASLVNTLALAYVGAALPLFLLFSYYKTQPVWVTVNSELIADEVVRTIVGSIALVLAVPLTTALAAYFFSRERVAAHD